MYCVKKENSMKLPEGSHSHGSSLLYVVPVFILFYLPAIPGLTAFLRLQLLKIILCTSCLLRIGEQLNHLVIYLNCILAVAFFLICISQNI